MIAIEAAVYSFEGITPELDAPPIAARRALDLAGVRLTIEGWRSLSVEDRQRLTLAGAAEVVDGEQVITAVKRAKPPPQRASPGKDPEATAPVEALIRALEPSRVLDARRWARLRGLDRYALMHTYRRAVARSSLMILGEAFDAIIAASALSPPGRGTLPSAPESSPSGGYLAPGVYSTVKTGPIAPIRPGAVPTPRAPVGPISSRATPSEPSEDDATLPGTQLGGVPAGAAVAVSTHVSPAGDVHMVDITAKPKTHRRAVAEAVVLMRPETAQRIAAHEAPKGEVLATARIAGIMAAKRTPELIPLCHGIALTKVTVDIEIDANEGRVIIKATAEAFDRTGVEMEAMVAASVAGLTIYDMLKGMDREMMVSEVKLLEKSGGRSGHFQRKDPGP